MISYKHKKEIKALDYINKIGGYKRLCIMYKVKKNPFIFILKIDFFILLITFQLLQHFSNFYKVHLKKFNSVSNF